MGFIFWRRLGGGLGGGPPKERLAVDSNYLAPSEIEDEQRIEQRRRLLKLEKALSSDHKLITARLADFEGLIPEEAADALSAALWDLGRAILHVARAQQREFAPGN